MSNLSGTSFAIDISGLIPIRTSLRAMPQQIEIATQRAILRTAQAVKGAEEAEMGRVFDRPTRFTLNALTIKIDKPRIQASVEVKDGYWMHSQNYLRTQIEGGKRHIKAFELALRRAGVLPLGYMAVPGEGARMDQYGNMAVGQIRQIMSWFDAAERVAGSTQNMGEKGRAKARKGTKRKAAFEYFAARPGHRIGRGSWKNGQTQTLTPGIYQRTFFGHGSAIKPVLIFIADAGYSKRYPFFETASRTVAATFHAEFDAAIHRELSKGAS